LLILIDDCFDFSRRVIPHERRLRDACKHKTKTKIYIIINNFLSFLANHNERRPLLSTGSLSPQPNESIDGTHQILTLPNQRHESFYSPIQSIDGMRRKRAHAILVLYFNYRKEKKKRKEKYIDCH